MSSDQQTLTWAVIIAVVLGIYNYESIERFFVLTDSQKQFRVLNLKKEVRLIQGCQRLNNRYTPRNQKQMTTHEVNMYKSPHLIVTFYGNNPEYPSSRCSVNIGYREVEYAFWNQGEYGNVNFCYGFRNCP
tara:strand:+ start:277 stop:669 length:393 start_codon:yes stop_codon:yes gene_type:complete